MERRDFEPVEWDAELEDDLRQLLRLAAREELRRGMDWTTVAMIAPERMGRAHLVARQAGVAAGLRAIPTLIHEWNLHVTWQATLYDGTPFQAGQSLGQFQGTVRDLLTAERTMLNLVSRLSGIATLTHQFVQAVAGTQVRIYDTRKTTPGWRLLEKYAVRCGGGSNHRKGLYDAFLIKDNHLAFADLIDRPHEAIHIVRQFVAQTHEHYPVLRSMLIEIEVDHLEQLQHVLPTHPDLVLLDNMSVGELREAVVLRNRLSPTTLLEASGGISLTNVAEVAATGVDRISVGALTHQAAAIDLGLDWQSGPGDCE